MSKPDSIMLVQTRIFTVPSKKDRIAFIEKYLYALVLKKLKINVKNIQSTILYLSELDNMIAWSAPLIFACISILSNA